MGNLGISVRRRMSHPLGTVDIAETCVIVRYSKNSEYPGKGQEEEEEEEEQSDSRQKH